MTTGYPLEESAASRAGVEYEVAGGATLPNLGQKRFAVMTREGALRGCQSHCADVSKSLNSVRSVVDGQSAVCFGLGPNGDQHMIINGLTGEINYMEGDGANYLQRMWVVPAEQTNAVRTAIANNQDVPGQGRQRALSL